MVEPKKGNVLQSNDESQQTFRHYDGIVKFCHPYIHDLWLNFAYVILFFALEEPENRDVSQLVVLFSTLGS